MYQITEESIKDFTDAFNLLNQLEIKGIQNVNILGNSVALLQRFFSSIKKIEEEIIINNSKEKINDK